MLNHGTTYVIYAPYIQRIVNLKIEMKFGYDGKHGAYQPHVVRGPAVPPPPPTAATVGTSAAAPASPAHAPSPPAMSRCAPSAAPESSHACYPSRQEAEHSRQGPQDLDLHVPLQRCSHP
jgi:hypothetical protein